MGIRDGGYRLASWRLYSAQNSTISKYAPGANSGRTDSVGTGGVSPLYRLAFKYWCWLVRVGGCLFKSFRHTVIWSPQTTADSITSYSALCLCCACRPCSLDRRPLSRLDCGFICSPDRIAGRSGKSPIHTFSKVLYLVYTGERKGRRFRSFCLSALL